MDCTNYDCNGTMEMTDDRLICRICNLVEYQQVFQPSSETSSIRRYQSMDNIQGVLNRLQAIHTRACFRFNTEYMDKLRERLVFDSNQDYSLSNIHKHLPNNDQRYLNFIYYKLTGDQLEIKWEHKDSLRLIYDTCYREYCTNPALIDKKPDALNIIKMAADTFPNLSYIKPYVYTKYNLPQKIYSILQTACLRAAYESIMFYNQF